MKFDLYVRTERCFNPVECVMWVVLPTTCVFFLADGRFGYDSLYTVKLGLLNNEHWVKILADADVGEDRFLPELR